MMVKEPVTVLHPRPLPTRLSPGPSSLNGYRVAPSYVPGVRACEPGASKSRNHQSPLAPLTEMLTVLSLELDTAIESPSLMSYEYDRPALTQSPGSPLKLKDPAVTVCALAGPAPSSPQTTAVTDRA